MARLHGIGTLFAGLVIISMLIVITAYIVHVYNIGLEAMREQQMLYEKARYLAEHSNITGDTVSLPEPADLIVVDPQGIPHVAENVTEITLPWPASQSKIYVAVTGHLRVGAADPVATALSMAASVAAAPLQGNASTAASALPNSYLDPLFMNYQDIVDVNDYRGCFYVGEVNWSALLLGAPNASVAIDGFTLRVGSHVVRLYSPDLYTYVLECDGVTVASVISPSPNTKASAVVDANTPCGNITGYIVYSWSTWGWYTYTYLNATIHVEANSTRFTYVADYQGSGTYTLRWTQGNMTWRPSSGSVLLLSPATLSITDGSTTYTNTSKVILDPRAQATANFTYLNYKAGTTTVTGWKAWSGAASSITISWYINNPGTFVLSYANVTRGGLVPAFTCP